MRVAVWVPRRRSVATFGSTPLASLVAARSLSCKSTTCYGKKSGQPLTEYESLSEATEGADHANRVHGSRWLMPYQCSNCGYYHLSPRERHTPSMLCVCVGATGEPKQLFYEQSAALRRAEILRAEKGLRVSVYACEHGLGYHLTRGRR